MMPACSASSPTPRPALRRSPTRMAVCSSIDQASAGSATITNQNSGVTSFGQTFGTDTATAGKATIINNDLGDRSSTRTPRPAARPSSPTMAAHQFLRQFRRRPDPLNPAKIVTNDGGQTFFNNNSDGGTAQFITVGTGFVDFSGSLGPNGDGRIHAGSIEGTGIYYIGAGNTLVVGGNNLSTDAERRDCRLQSSAGLRLSADSRHRQFRERRHRKPDPVRHQHLYRHHDRQWRQADRQRLDRVVERQHRQFGWHARRQRRGQQRHRQCRRHARRQRLRRQHHHQRAARWRPAIRSA